MIWSYLLLPPFMKVNATRRDRIQRDEFTPQRKHEVYYWQIARRPTEKTLRRRN